MSDDRNSKVLATAIPVREAMGQVAELGFPASVFVAFGPGRDGKGTVAATHLHGPPGTDFRSLIKLVISSLEHDLEVMRLEEDDGTPPAPAGGFVN